MFIHFDLQEHIFLLLHYCVQYIFNCSSQVSKRAKSYEQNNRQLRKYVRDSCGLNFHSNPSSFNKYLHLCKFCKYSFKLVY